MTREEAIKILHEPNRIGFNMIKANDIETSQYNLDSNTALQMAILALEQEPYDDTISRDVAKAEYRKRFINNLKDDKRGIDLSKYAEEPCKKFNEFIDSLPSVTQKYGEWKVTPMSKIAYCSICDKLIKNVPTSIVTQFEYCPKCGARMVEP